MRGTYFTCFLALLSIGSNAQQDFNESAGPEVAYEINNSPAREKFTKYSLPQNGVLSEVFNTKPLYVVGVRNGKMHGTWQSWYQNGLPCDSGRMVKGLPDGEWKHWDNEGRLIAVRHYSADKYQRVRNELVRHHPRKISFPMTQLYQQSRREALRRMHVSYSFAAAAVKHPAASLQEWVYTNITPGNAYKPVFDHSLHHGLYMNIYASGHARDSGFYRDGLRQGLWLHRDSTNGTTLTGSYVNGAKVKEWKLYDMHGRLKEILFYNAKGHLKWRKQARKAARIQFDS
jgi:antitoxin component YwqK of YwqJK toxin-antitoxin module